MQLLHNELMSKFKAANERGDQQTAMQYYKERSKLLKKHGVSMAAPFYGLLFQLPLGIGFFYGVRRILNSAEYLPSITQDGPLWLYDLTVPDPYYALPLASMACGIASAFANPNQSGIPSLGVPNDQMRRFFMMTSVSFSAVTAMFPAGMQLLILSGSFTVLMQQLMVRVPFLQRLAGIPSGFPNPPPLPTAGQTPEEALEMYRASQLTAMQNAAKSPFMGFFMADEVKASIARGVIPPGFGDLSGPVGAAGAAAASYNANPVSGSSRAVPGLGGSSRPAVQTSESGDYITWKGLQAPPPPPPPPTAQPDAGTEAPTSNSKRLLTQQELAKLRKARAPSSASGTKRAAGKGKRSGGKRGKK